MSLPKIVESVRFIAIKPNFISFVSELFRFLYNDGLIVVFNCPSLRDPGSASVSMYVSDG